MAIYIGKNNKELEQYRIIRNSLNYEVHFLRIADDNITCCYK